MEVVENMRFFKKIVSGILACTILVISSAAFAENYKGTKGVDIEITDVWLEHPDFAIGEHSVIVMKARNIGNAYYYQGQLTVSNLLGATSPSGANSITLTAQRTMYPDGKEWILTSGPIRMTDTKVTGTVQLTADGDINPGNNKISFSFESSAKAVDLELSEIRIEPTDFKAGDSVKVFVDIRNGGGKDMEYQNVSFDIDCNGKKYSRQRATRLASKESQTIEITDIVADSEALNITLEVNKDKSVKETYFANNTIKSLKNAFVTADDYVMGRVGLACGGCNTGGVADPKSGLMYFQSDVDGFYRYYDEIEWFDDIFSNLRNTYDSQFCCDGIAILEGDPNVIFAMCGIGGKGWRGYYDLKDTWRTLDGGKTWTRMYMPAGGGSGTRKGECIMLDQNDPNVLYVCGEGAAYRCDNALSANPKWTKINFPGASTVWGSRTTDGQVCGLAIDRSEKIDGRSKNIYFSCYENGVYRSTNGGKTFGLVSGSPIGVRSIAVDSKGIVYATTTSKDGGVYKYDGKKWSMIFEQKTGIRTVQVSHFDDNILAATSDKNLFISTDAGANWRNMKNNSKVTQSSKYNETAPPWQHMDTLIFDAKNPKAIWFGDFYCCFKTEDFTADTVEFRGISNNWEELCLTNLKASAGADRIMGTTMDGTMWIVENDETFFDQNYSKRDTASKNVTTSLTMNYSAGNPDFMIGFGGKSWEQNPCDGAYTFDGGITWTGLSDNGKMLQKENGSGPMPVYNVAVSSGTNENGNPTIVVTTGSSGIWRTTDLGENWEKAKSTITGVSGWGASVCLAADPFVNGKYYVYEPKTGIFAVSVDDGKSFTTTATLPSQSGYLREFYSTPNYLAIALGPTGLWITKDGGKTFETAKHITEAIMVGTGKAKTGYEHDTLYVFGYIGDEKGIFRSYDLGQNWTKITNDEIYGEFGSGKGLDGDKFREDVCYYATYGSGVVALMTNEQDFRMVRASVDITNEQYVRNPEFTVKGRINIELPVEISVNGTKTTVEPNQYMEFTKDVVLNEGVNTIKVEVPGTQYRKSFEEQYTVYYDPKFIDIIPDENNIVVSESEYIVKGRLNCSASVYVNGEAASLDEGLRFEHKVTLTEGENNIAIEAIDAEGNRAEKTATITLDTVGPVLDLYVEDGYVTDKFYLEIPATLNELSDITFNGEKKTYGKGDVKFMYALTSGENEIKFELQDMLGNKSEKTLNVIFEPTYEFSDEKNVTFVQKGSANIDGKISEGEWMLDRLMGRVTDGETDSFGIFGMKTDGEYLYYALEVYDNKVATHGKPMGNDYNQDCIEIFIDPDSNRGTSYDKRDMQIRYDINGGNYTRQKSGATANTTIAGSETDFGWVIEVKVPLSELNLNYSEGGSFNFECALNDSSEVGSRDGVISWMAGSDAWTNTASFGTAIFR